MKNFPTWTILSIGFPIIMSLLFMDASSPMLSRTEVWGVLALVPLFVTLLISFLIHPSGQPLKQLYNQIKEDKSVLFFILYGMLLLVFYIGFDEINRPFLFIYPIILTVLIITTSILYLESKNKTRKTLIFIFGTLIPTIIAIIGIVNLFDRC